MATSLAPVRLHPWQQQHHQDVMVEMACGVVKVRAFGGYHPRGRVCRVPPMTTSSRRETLTSAMSEDHDITDMQELADGSLFFSFGPGSSNSDDASSRPASKTIAAAAASSNTEPTAAATIPRRHASSFRKQSPIPASRKKANELKKAAAPPTTAQPPPEEEGHINNKKPPKKEHKAKTTPSKAPAAAQPHRPPSSFFKRSPIPKDRASSSKKQTLPAIEASSEETVVEPAKELPTSPELLSRGKESAKSAKVGASEAPGKKKVASKVLRAETVVEVAQTSIEAPGKSLSAVEIEESTTTTVEVVAAAAAAENGAVKQDLSSYKLTELRSLAKARGLRGYSKLKKGELVELLAGLDS